MNMRRQGKRRGIDQIQHLIALLSVGLLVCFASGCAAAGETAQRQNIPAPEETISAAATGRYLEQVSPFSDEIQYYAMTVREDGTLLLIAGDGVYESEDKGESWERSARTPEFFEQADAALLEIDYARAMPDGRMFFQYAEDKYAEQKFLYISSDGTMYEPKLQLPEEDLSPVQYDWTEDLKQMEEAQPAIVMHAELADEDTLVAMNRDGMLYHMDAKTGAILAKVDAGGAEHYIEAYICQNDKLIVRSETGIDLYDLESGILLERDEGLDAYFDPEVYRTDIFGMAASAQADTFYYCDSSGVYRYVLGSGQPERLINGAAAILSNPDYYFVDLMAASDGSFYTYGYMGKSESRFCHYFYSEQVSAYYDHELTVYGLEFSVAVRQAISDFQEQHPNYYVTYEIGLEEEAGLELQDVIRNLNTRIMSGNGPDILLLDGLPAESYIAQGVLLDLSADLVQWQQDNPMLEAVVNTYQTETGLGAVPTRFTLQYVIGEEHILAETDTPSRLAALAAKARTEQPDLTTILGTYPAHELLSLLADYYGSSLITEDGTVSETDLKQFMDSAKRIYEVNNKAAEAEVREWYENYAYPDDEPLISPGTVLTGAQYLGMMQIRSVDRYNQLLALCEYAGWEAKLLERDGAVLYQPHDVIGISAASSDAAAGKVFIEYLLSASAQAKNDFYNEQGLPVSLAAYDEIYEYYLTSYLPDEGRYGEFDYPISEDESESAAYIVRTQAEYEAFTQSLQELSQANVLADVIKNAICREAACLTGESDMDEAVQRILSTVNIYLSE